MAAPIGFGGGTDLQRSLLWGLWITFVGISLFLVVIAETAPVTQPPILSSNAVSQPGVQSLITDRQTADQSLNPAIQLQCVFEIAQPCTIGQMTIIGGAWKIVPGEGLCNGHTKVKICNGRFIQTAWTSSHVQINPRLELRPVISQTGPGCLSARHKFTEGSAIRLILLNSTGHVQETFEVKYDATSLNGEWSSAHFTVEIRNAMKIHIEANLSSPESEVALDDVTLQLGSCMVSFYDENVPSSLKEFDVAIDSDKSVTLSNPGVTINALPPTTTQDAQVSSEVSTRSGGQSTSHYQSSESTTTHNDTLTYSITPNHTTNSNISDSVNPSTTVLNNLLLKPMTSVQTLSTQIKSSSERVTSISNSVVGLSTPTVLKSSEDLQAKTSVDSRTSNSGYESTKHFIETSTKSTETSRSSTIKDESEPDKNIWAIPLTVALVLVIAGLVTLLVVLWCKFYRLKQGIAGYILDSQTTGTPTRVFEERRSTMDRANEMLSYDLKTMKNRPAPNVPFALPEHVASVARPDSSVGHVTSEVPKTRIWTENDTKRGQGSNGESIPHGQQLQVGKAPVPPLRRSKQGRRSGVVMYTSPSVDLTKVARVDLGYGNPAFDNESSDESVEHTEEFTRHSTGASKVETYHRKEWVDTLTVPNKEKIKGKPLPKLKVSASFSLGRSSALPPATERAKRLKQSASVDSDMNEVFLINGVLDSSFKDKFETKEDLSQAIETGNSNLDEILENDAEERNYVFKREQQLPNGKDVERGPSPVQQSIPQNKDTQFDTNAKEQNKNVEYDHLNFSNPDLNKVKDVNTTNVTPQRKSSQPDYLIPIIMKAKSKIFQSRQARKLEERKRAQSTGSTPYTNHSDSDDNDSEVPAPFKGKPRSASLPKEEDLDAASFSQTSSDSQTKESVVFKFNPVQRSLPFSGIGDSQLSDNRVPSIVLHNETGSTIDDVKEGGTSSRPQSRTSSPRLTRIPRANDPFCIERLPSYDLDSEAKRRRSMPSMSQESHFMTPPTGTERLFRSVSGDALSHESQFGRTQRNTFDRSTEHRMPRFWSAEFYEHLRDSHPEDPLSLERMRKLINDRYDALFAHKFQNTSFSSYLGEPRFSHLSLSPRSVKRRDANKTSRRVSQESRKSVGSSSSPSLHESSLASPQARSIGEDNSTANCYNNNVYDDISMNQDFSYTVTPDTLPILQHEIRASSPIPKYDDFSVRLHKSTGDIANLKTDFIQAKRPELARGEDGMESDTQVDTAILLPSSNEEVEMRSLKSHLSSGNHDDRLLINTSAVHKVSDSKSSKSRHHMKKRTRSLDRKYQRSSSQGATNSLSKQSKRSQEDVVNVYGQQKSVDGNIHEKKHGHSREHKITESKYTHISNESVSLKSGNEAMDARSAEDSFHRELKEKEEKSSPQNGKKAPQKPARARRQEWANAQGSTSTSSDKPDKMVDKRASLDGWVSFDEFNHKFDEADSSFSGSSSPDRTSYIRENTWSFADENTTASADVLDIETEKFDENYLMDLKIRSESFAAGSEWHDPEGVGEDSNLNYSDSNSDIFGIPADRKNSVSFVTSANKIPLFHKSNVEGVRETESRSPDKFVASRSSSASLDLDHTDDVDDDGREAKRNQRAYFSNSDFEVSDV